MKTFVVMHKTFVRGQGTMVEELSAFSTKAEAKNYIMNNDVILNEAVCKKTDDNFKEVVKPTAGERKFTSKDHGSIYKKIDTFYIREEVR